MNIRVSVGVGVILACIVIGGFLGVAWSTAWKPAIGQFVRDFCTSPAFAGLCAVGAAGIAWTGISKQAEATREAASTAKVSADAMLEHSRDSAQASLTRQLDSDEQASWWQSFEWLSVQVRGLKESDIGFPVDKFRMSTEDLESRASYDAQRFACSGLMEVLVIAGREAQARLRTGESVSLAEGGPSAAQLSPGNDIDVNSETKSLVHREVDVQRDVVQAWIDVVKETGGDSERFSGYADKTIGSAAQSSGILYALYEDAALGAIERQGLKVHRTPYVDALVDAVVELKDGRKVGIEFFFPPSIEQFSRSSRMKVRQMKSLASVFSSRHPVVLVSRFRRNIDGLPTKDLSCATWASEADTSDLIRALELATGR